MDISCIQFCVSAVPSTHSMVLGACMSACARLCVFVFVCVCVCVCVCCVCVWYNHWLAHVPSLAQIVVFAWAHADLAFNKLESSIGGGVQVGCSIVAMVLLHS